MRMRRTRNVALIGAAAVAAATAAGVAVANAVTGPSSSESPYVIRSRPGVVTKSILTVGDSVAGYRMVGIPDGLGAFDNGDGTFTLLMNHELRPGQGVARAHGANGAFVSRWTIDKDTLVVTKGEDLIEHTMLWTAGGYSEGATQLNRLCSADLPSFGAFYNASTGKGFNGRLFMDGEESGNEGRGFAHNGHLEGLDVLDEQLGDYRRLVHGDTDSERFFALVTKETDANGGDPGAGLASAARWAAANLPLYALNCILATATDVWALRYPETHELLMLERGQGGVTGRRHFDAGSRSGRIRVRSGALAACPAVVFASEPMDEDPGWRMLAPGELVHVDRKLGVTCDVAIDRPPARPLTLEDLHPEIAASQR